MFDPLSLILAAMLSLQAGATTNPDNTDSTRAVIIDTGSPATEQPPAPEDQARSQIIDIGNQ
jgi:hypothetical protein